MKTHSLTCESSGEESTARIAAALGPALSKGDVVLLEGDIGTGKTLFARRLIQSLQQCPEDVPSPSFTLVQVYDTKRGQIWHTDLYRLSSPNDVEELGLSAAFQNEICLVEWPDRLGGLAPSDALWVRFELGEEDASRHITFSWQHERWSSIVEKVLK